MSRKSDVDALMREARELGLSTERHGMKWKVTNPATGDHKFLPAQGSGRSLLNIRSDIRRLAGPSPMEAAVAAPADGSGLAGHAFAEWSVADLLELAEHQGVKVRERGGYLSITCDVDAEPVARLLRDREAEVLAHLNPQTSGEEVMARIADTARVTRKKDTAGDAEALWDLITDEEFIAALAARLKGGPGASERIAELETANAALRSRIEDLARELAEKDARLKAYDAAAAIFRGTA